MADRVVVLMGSGSDEEHAKKIGATVEEFGLKAEYRVASAHKTPEKVLSVLKELEDSGDRIVLVAVVGLSNALSGMLAGQSVFPIVTCPVFAREDLFSSLRMPSDVPHAVVLNPKNAALEALRILALSNGELKKKLVAHRQKARGKVERADEKLRA
ncbi:MAG: AIR carboxylase family protein [Candidatus Micrarchaeia archaeon]